MKHVVLGTAGHIDHGKSSLVKALTGVDPDRLKEEKQRGITIDLGFANLTYSDGTVVGIVDVPGHEKLVRNMLAGAGGIDLMLLVVAADEGVMPQTKEHMAICELLGIKAGLTAITKIDLVERDWLELVIEDVRDFLKGTPLENSDIIPVSSKTGENIELLKQKIHEYALKTEERSSGGYFRLPIDRVFTLKGFGTVVTGTAISGTVKLDSDIEILPSAKRSKVRGIHSHGKKIEEGRAGQRLAINLQGIEKEEIKRGDICATPGVFRTTTVVDVSLRLLKGIPELKNKSLVHFHLYTAEAIGRVLLYDTDKLKPGETSFAQIRLDRPVVALSGDRFVIRRFSPVVTIGGGMVLDPYTRRRKRKEGISDLEVYEKGSLREKLSTKVLRSGFKGISKKELLGWIKEDIRRSSDAIKDLNRTGEILEYNGRLLHRRVFENIEKRLVETISRFHKNNPLKPGMKKEELRSLFGLPQAVFQGIISLSEKIVSDKETVRLKDFKVIKTDRFAKLKEDILKILKERAFQPPSREELAENLRIKPREVEDILKLLSDEGELIRITDAYYLRRDDYQRMIELLREFFQRQDSITVSEFRDMLKTTRKYALPFLEHLDSNRFTMRVGDKRKKHPAFK